MRISSFFKQDSFGIGILSVLIIEILIVGIISVGLVAFGQSITQHVRWYGAVYIFALMVVRYYAKGGQSKSLKSAIAIFFITFVAFIYYLFTTNQIDLK